MTEFLKIKNLAQQAGRQNNCKIYDIYKHRDRLQIFIEKTQQNLKVRLEDCENVFHSLRFLLHSAMPHILEHLRLEVSSPGIERRLREKWHFEESIGQKLKLTTNSSIKAKNTKTGKDFLTQSFKAYLLFLSKENLFLKIDFKEYSVPLSKVKSAHIVFETIRKNPKNKKRNQNLQSEVSHVS